MTGFYPLDREATHLTPIAADTTADLAVDVKADFGRVAPEEGRSGPASSGHGKKLSPDSRWVKESQRSLVAEVRRLHVSEGTSIRPALRQQRDGKKLSEQRPQRRVRWATELVSTEEVAQTFGAAQVRVPEDSLPVNARADTETARVTETLVDEVTTALGRLSLASEEAEATNVEIAAPAAFETAVTDAFATIETRGGRFTRGPLSLRRDMKVAATGIRPAKVTTRRFREERRQTLITKAAGKWHLEPSEFPRVPLRAPVRSQPRRVRTKAVGSSTTTQAGCSIPTETESFSGLAPPAPPAPALEMEWSPELSYLHPGSEIPHLDSPEPILADVVVPPLSSLPAVQFTGEEAHLPALVDPALAAESLEEASVPTPQPVVAEQEEEDEDDALDGPPPSPPPGYGPQAVLAA